MRLCQFVQAEIKVVVARHEQKGIFYNFSGELYGISGMPVILLFYIIYPAAKAFAAAKKAEAPRDYLVGAYYYKITTAEFHRLSYKNFDKCSAVYFHQGPVFFQFPHPEVFRVPAGQYDAVHF